MAISWYNKVFPAAQRQGDVEDDVPYGSKHPSPVAHTSANLRPSRKTLKKPKKLLDKSGHP